jgi:mono/diheme cytochrome c family protein
MKQMAHVTLALAGLIGLLSLISCASETKEEQSLSSSVVDLTEIAQHEMGEIIYRKTCRLCHGYDGKKMMGGASDLSESPLDLEERIAVITNGRGNMMSYSKNLSSEEIQAVAIYLKSLVNR